MQQLYQLAKAHAYNGQLLQLLRTLPTALFVSISQVIGCEDRLRNDLYCVEWGVKLCSTNPSGSIVPFILVGNPVVSIVLQHN